MTTKNPRIYVTLDESDAECVLLLAKKRNLSASSMIRKMVEDSLEEFEDEQLAIRAILSEKEWIAGGRKTISHEEVCKLFDIK
jgi:hypothetical protein